MYRGAAELTNRKDTRDRGQGMVALFNFISSRYVNCAYMHDKREWILYECCYNRTGRD